jgi:NAD(P)-dependent dehydrogenase (short-subunit alcohol dehydrogenase family)
MFEKAFKLHGKIDVVLANAGITELKDIFSDELEQDGTSLAEPKLPVLDVCLKGLVYSKCFILLVFIATSFIP